MKPSHIPGLQYFVFFIYTRQVYPFKFFLNAQYKKVTDKKQNKKSTILSIINHGFKSPNNNYNIILGGGREEEWKHTHSPKHREAEGCTGQSHPTPLWTCGFQFHAYPPFWGGGGSSAQLLLNSSMVKRDLGTFQIRNIQCRAGRIACEETKYQGGTGEEGQGVSIATGRSSG